MIHHQIKAWARSILEDADTCEANEERTAGGNIGRRCAKEELDLLRHSSDFALGICADAPSVQCGEVRRLGKLLGNILVKRQVLHVTYFQHLAQTR